MQEIGILGTIRSQKTLLLCGFPANLGKITALLTLKFMQSYLKRILTARVYDVAIESPLEMAPSLSARIGNQIMLKREDMQPVFSFKLRGAYNKMAQLTPEQLKRGVITASAGNHVQVSCYFIGTINVYGNVADIVERKYFNAVAL